MRIAIVAPELVPFSKTGGLADVAGALPGAFAALGADVLTVSPLHRAVRKHRLERDPRRIRVPLGGSTVEGGVARAGNAWFLEQDEFFDREGLYGTAQGDYTDNAARFAFFCRGALELLVQLGAPDVVHVHDWQSGLVPIYLKTLYADRFPRTRSVLTIHNLAYQGLFWHWDMPLTGLDWKHFNWRELEFYGKLSFLKAGLVFADALTTVSPTYAREIQTEELGCGMDGVLRERAGRLQGILNGVDYAEWDPQIDRHLAAPYGPAAPAGKARCKAALQARCGLAARPETPLVGMIGRLTEQKGIDILLPALETLAAEDLQLVILGSGDKRYQEPVVKLGARFPGKISVNIAFDNSFAHQIEAGSDMFLMPSRYEPCGLNQIYSLKYGTVPVVRSTGGLADTVEDGATGFAFREYAPEALVGAVRRALAAYADRKAWRKMMLAGMALDFSWTASARRYLGLFESLVGAKPGGAP